MEPYWPRARENIEGSPWKERLHLFYGDVKQFAFQKQYDFIISNPPFYEGDLKSDASNRNVAMHDAGIKLDELLQVVDKNLSEDGSFAVLLPYNRTDQFIGDAIKNGLFLFERMNVKQSVNHSFFRSVLLFERKKGNPEMKELSIKDETNQYTESFIKLLKDYYLYL